MAQKLVLTYLLVMIYIQRCNCEIHVYYPKVHDRFFGEGELLRSMIEDLNKQGDYIANIAADYQEYTFVKRDGEE